MSRKFLRVRFKTYPFVAHHMYASDVEVLTNGKILHSCKYSLYIYFPKLCQEDVYRTCVVYHGVRILIKMLIFVFALIRICIFINAMKFYHVIFTV